MDSMWYLKHKDKIQRNWTVLSIGVILSGYLLYWLTFDAMNVALQGVQGVFQILLVIVSGLMLGPWKGLVMAVAISLSSGFLWARSYESGFWVMTSWVLISASVSTASGWAGNMVRRIRNQASELNRANEALRVAQNSLRQSEKLTFLGELTASISHELNQPLTIINMGAELAMMNLPETNPGVLKENIEQILEQSERARKIIQHMKMLGRRESGNVFKTCSLNDILRNSINLVGEQLRLGNIALDIQLTGESTTVEGDSIQLEMLFSNLLLNARDALEASEQKQITIATSRKNGFVHTAVRDSGVGMPSAVVDRIFEPFFTTKEVGKGTGLGLSISYRIIQDHGGTIEVESGPGQGTTFQLKFPVSATAT